MKDGAAEIQDRGDGGWGDGDIDRCLRRSGVQRCLDSIVKLPAVPTRGVLLEKIEDEFQHLLEFLFSFLEVQEFLGSGGSLFRHDLSLSCQREHGYPMATASASADCKLLSRARAEHKLQAAFHALLDPRSYTSSSYLRPMLRTSKLLCLLGGTLLGIEILLCYLFQQYSSFIESDTALRLLTISFAPVLDSTAILTLIGCIGLAFYMPSDQSLNLGLAGVAAATIMLFFVRFEVHDWRALVPADAHDWNATVLVLMMLLFSGGLLLVGISWIRLLRRTPQ